MTRARKAATFGTVIGFIVVIVGIILIVSARPDPEAVWADRSAELANSVMGDPSYKATDNVEQARDKAAQDKMIGVIVLVVGGLVLLASIAGMIMAPKSETKPQ